MNRPSSVTALLLASVAIACGSDKTSITPPPPPPASQSYSMTVSSGDAQKGPFSTTLPAPLVVSVTTSGGVPAANVKVNWGVVAGDGTLSSASSVTDANGKASISWTLGPSPNVNQVVKAWTDAEGSQSAQFSSTGEATLVLHFDGTTWTRSLLTEQYAITVNTGWAASPTTSFAAGTHCQNPFVLTFSSGAWSGADKCAGTSLVITDLSGTSASDLWAVGTGHGARIMDPNFTWLFHFDGSGWTTSYMQDLSQGNALFAVAPRNADDVIAVGAKGTIIRHAGQQWNQQTSGTTNDLLAVWGDPNSGSAFAVGAAGTIVYNNGANWQVQPSGTTAALHSVWGSSGSNVFAVGDNGTILHFNGTSWSAQSSGTTQKLRGVWGSSATAVFAVGAGGTVLRYDGTQWTPQSTGFQMDFTNVWGTSPSDVFVSGQ